MGEPNPDYSFYYHHVHANFALHWYDSTFKTPNLVVAQKSTAPSKALHLAKKGEMITKEHKYMLLFPPAEVAND